MEMFANSYFGLKINASTDNKFFNSFIRFIVVFVLFILSNIISCNCVFADIIPADSTSIKHYGIGVLNLRDSFTVYSEPNESSKILKIVDYENQKSNMIIGAPKSYENTLVVYVPSKSAAFVSVESNDEDGWYEIYYDQVNGRTGWVRQSDQDAFMTWRNFFYIWGKKNGLVFFRDVPHSEKKIFSQESEESQRLGDFTYVKNINFSMINGNWMLVSVLDVGQSVKIGWMRWRNDDGSLRLFPKFREQTQF